MFKKMFLVAIATGFLFTSCNRCTKQQNDECGGANHKHEHATEAAADTQTSTLTSADGSTLEMTFDNAAGKVVVVFNGEVIEMESMRPASGIWYKNDNYELSGKGSDVELIKDGTVVFKSK